MTEQLAAIFGEVGISQYLDTFVEQGFDTWETILDITESDLDALGVKLGHRRKLQRRIANSRGLAPDASLAALKQPVVEEAQADPPSTAQQLVKLEIRDVTPVVVTKRKYRRHPKPDENAPERPPSAYVLFSNKMRDDLKGRNLTFTEIAKLVGENWQNLSPAEKEPFETQAQTAKDRYNAQLNEYKKTPLYKRYQDYLQEFKAKHAHQSQEKEKEGTKRIKLSSAESYANSSGTPTRQSRSGSGSGSDCQQTPNKAFPSQRHGRLGSAVSAPDSQLSVTPAMRQTSLDEAVYSPRSTHPLERPSSERSHSMRAGSHDEVLSMAHRRGNGWHAQHRGDPNGPLRLLPSLSDVFEYRSVVIDGGPHPGDLQGYPFPQNVDPDSTRSPPALVGGNTKPPSLQHEQSSSGSLSSASSYGFPRTPIDGSLSIHALLSEKPQHQSFGAMPQYPLPHLYHRQQSIDGMGMSFSNGFAPAPDRRSIPLPSPPLPLPTTQASYPGQANVGHSATKPQSNPSLDGMSALLRAGEVLDGQSPR